MRVAVQLGPGERVRPRVDASLVTTVEQVEGVADADVVVRGFAQLVTSDGRAVEAAGMGAATLGANWIPNPALNPFHLVDGSAPATADEVVIDRGSARRAGLVVGDEVEAVTGNGTSHVRVVGIAAFGTTDSPAGTSMVLFTTDAAEELVGQPGRVDSIAIEAAPGVELETVAGRVRNAVPGGLEVLTGAEATAEAQDDAAKSVASFSQFLLAFGVIGLFVGSFIIYNTFSIVVAQRRRETALLRALGAGRRQVLGGVLLESAIIGTVAAAVGLGLGVATAEGLTVLMGAMGIDLPDAGLVVSGSTMMTAIVVGTVVSIASALLPARSAAKVAPLAAMRDVAVDRSHRQRRRVVLAVAVAAAAAGMITSGTAGDGGLGTTGLGAALLVAAVVVGGPFLVRPVVRVLGWPLARTKGVTGHLARTNALRNPATHLHHRGGVDDRRRAGGGRLGARVDDEGIDRLCDRDVVHRGLRGHHRRDERRHPRPRLDRHPAHRGRRGRRGARSPHGRGGRRLDGPARRRRSRGTRRRGRPRRGGRLAGRPRRRRHRRRRDGREGRRPRRRRHRHRHVRRYRRPRSGRPRRLRRR